MGMGEPLANYNAVVRALGNLISEEGMNFSHRTVTLSTCGLVLRSSGLGGKSGSIWPCLSMPPTMKQEVS